jgi:riboflavin kinase/FMN adenylyltransferase
VERWRGLDAAPAGWGRSVVTIGTFDGVHLGHRLIISHAVERARAAGLPSVLMTFDPHPSEVVRPGSHPALLTTTRYKAELIEPLGIDVVLVVPFTSELSKWSPERFGHEMLVEKLQASSVVVGDNFTFGHKAAGDVTLLHDLGRRFGFTVEGVPLLGDGDSVWSSTAIRTLVAAGDVAGAAVGLTRDHRVEGLVVRGDQRGRELGYPTANLHPVPHAAVPADGVYAGWLVRSLGNTSIRLPAAISIGTNPTFEGRERRVEAFVLDFSGDLYGESVGFDFTARLRGTETFASVDDLVVQMAIDVAQSREILGV